MVSFPSSILWLVISLLAFSSTSTATAKSTKDMDISLGLDKAFGLLFKSKKEYLFGKIGMQLELARNFASTVTAYYLPSQGPNHDEIHYAFVYLSTSGDPCDPIPMCCPKGEGKESSSSNYRLIPPRTFIPTPFFR